MYIYLHCCHLFSSRIHPCLHDDLRALLLTDISQMPTFDVSTNKMVSQQWNQVIRMLCMILYTIASFAIEQFGHIIHYHLTMTFYYYCAETFSTVHLTAFWQIVKYNSFIFIFFSSQLYLYLSDAFRTCSKAQS